MGGAPDKKFPKPWARGPAAVVFAYDGFESDFSQINERSRSKIEATIKEQYVQFGPQNIHREKLNRNEGRHKIGGQEILVQAFKHYQARVYGVEGSCANRRAFFISAIDVAKKKDKADRQLLRRAAEGSLELAQCIPQAKIGRQS